MNIDINQFDYHLPDERIARNPLPERDKCKLLTLNSEGEIGETIFNKLPDLIESDSILIYNNTRVINARLRFTKASGACIEIFCLEPAEPADYAQNFASTQQCSWICLVGNSKRWKEGELSQVIEIDGEKTTLRAQRISRNESGESVVLFSWEGNHSFSEVIEAAGEIPIPPYLNRDSEESDSVDYQTVFSHIEGSVAAPTAGLHFTEEVLNRLTANGVRRREVTLHVGAGTFRPVKCDNVSDHEMHSEWMWVPRSLIEELRDNCGKSPVVAVGTTSVRTLESLYQIGCMIGEGIWQGQVPQWYPYNESHPNLTVAQAMQNILDHINAKDSQSTNQGIMADTKIIIAPGYKYRIVNRMITNFHQPHSTLLLLVSAFIGDTWKDAYDYALNHNFRFLSYGDACLFDKKR